MQFFLDSKAMPTQAVQGQFDLVYVALSYVIAVVAARIALHIVQEITHTDVHSRRRGCVLGSLIMGAGIWSMHFTGMLAYKMTMYHTYSLTITALSLGIAILFSYVVFWNITRERLSFLHVLANAPLLGLGVATMHYMGMAAMQMDADIRYISLYFWLSLGIAITASGAALWIMRTVSLAKNHRYILNTAASFVLGLGVCGMHYMGMAAAVFLPYADCRYVIDQNNMGMTIFVGILTFFIFAQGLFLVSKGFLKATSIKETLFSRFGFYGIIFFIGMCGLAGVGLLHSISVYNEEIALETFKKEEQLKTFNTQDKFKDFFEAVYTNIRTISRLPSVRAIDRHGTNINTNDRITIQENYNNLASFAHLSEVYITSKDFDPDKIDPITKKLEEPTIMFDQLIVGRTKEDYLKKEDVPDPNKPSIEELEIEEYHLIKEQIAYFQKHYPTLDTIKGFDIPAISGREVITCDNSRYSPKAPNDADRSGFVYSVPFYGVDGKFKGVVSAIFLTHVFRDYLGSSPMALLNSTPAKAILPHKVPLQMEDSSTYITKSIPDPRLYYSEVIPLPFHDAANVWKLWVGVPNTLFYESTHYTTIMHFRLIGYAVLATAVFLGLLCFFLMRRNYTLEENELRQAIKKSEDANNAKSEFLANMSHELRTPMHAILNYTNMSLKRSEQYETIDDKLVKFLSNIKISGERLLNLLNDLLDLSKLESGKMTFNMEKASLHQAMDHSLSEIDSLIREKNLHIYVEGETLAMNHEILYDKQRLIQVFVNVLSNAIKFSPIGSSIQIDYSLQENKDNDRYLHCVIRDEGSGIPEGEEEKIFDKFIQSSKTKTNAGGTGLGLSICKEIISNHKGELWAQNRTSGTGAEFIVSLPLEEIS